MGGRLSFFLPAWQRITSDQCVPEVIRQGYSFPFVKHPPLSLSHVDSVAQAAVQTTSAAGRGFVPPNQGGRGDCQSFTGPGVILFPLLPDYQAHWWVVPHLQPAWTQLVYSSCQVPHGDPHFYSAGSSQRLVDGVAGSQARPTACADTPQSLAVSLVCSQEPGRGAYCLSMEGSPFWVSHCSQSFYQTLGSSSSTLASAGISDVSIHG